MKEDSELIKLGFALFAIFVGAGYDFVNTENTEQAGVIRRLYSQFAAVVLVGMLAGGALLFLHWNVWAVAIGGFALAIAAERFLSHLRNYFRESNNLLDFIQRLVKAYQSTKSGNSNNDVKPQ